MKQRRVVCAACRVMFNTAEVVTFLGARHWDTAMRKLMDETQYAILDKVDEEQGFIDQAGIFMGRHEAWKVAEAAGQILYRCGGDEYGGGTLYSENLY